MFKADNEPCDCITRHYLYECCTLSTPPYRHFKNRIDLGQEMVVARSNFQVDDRGRKPNNLQRKRLYRLIFLEMDFGVVQCFERRKLPNCAVAKVRQIYPDDTGSYMGHLDK